MRAMKAQYGSKEGEKVFYASKNKGTIKGVEDETQMNWQNKLYESLVEEKDEPAKVVVTKAEKDRRRDKVRRDRMDRTGKSLIKPKTTMFKGYTVPK